MDRLPGLGGDFGQAVKTRRGAMAVVEPGFEVGTKNDKENQEVRMTRAIKMNNTDSENENYSDMLTMNGKKTQLLVDSSDVWTLNLFLDAGCRQDDWNSRHRDVTAAVARTHQSHG